MDIKYYTLLGLGLIVLIFLILMSPKSLCNPYGIASKVTCTQMGSIKQALKMFKLDNGIYPSTKEGLDALVKNPNNKKYPNYSTSPYIERLPLDYLGNPFRYNFYKIDKRNKFEIIAFGADGKYGGEGENEDIVYPDCNKEKKFFEPLF